MGLFTKRVSLEAQLERLAQLGLRLNPGVGERHLTTFADRAALEKAPFKQLVEVMGITLEEEPYTPLCNRLWMCDYERVEDHGAYVEVVRRLETMTGGALGLAAIRDHVDLDSGVAWVEFDHREVPVHWDLKVDDDWLDPSVLLRYDELLRASRADVRIYANHRDYGQVAFLVALAPQHQREFEQLTKVKLGPLRG